MVMMMAWSTKAKKNAYQASWDKKKVARWREAGNCIRCGAPCKVNPHTGRPFAHCFKHQQRAAKHTKIYLDRTRNRKKGAR